MMSRVSYSFFLWLTFATIQGAVAQEAVTDDSFWRADLAAARVEAKAAGKPLFVIFRCER